MRARTIIVLGLAAFFWTPDASAQFLKNALKKAATKVGQQVKQEVTQKVGGKTEAAQPATKKTAKKGSTTKKTASNAVSATWPTNHTALFAPIGPAVNPAYGTKTVKATKPPKEDAKQPDWNDARTYVYELDNQSLIEEYILLNECLMSKYIRATSPATFRLHSVMDEMVARADILNKIVEAYNEAEDHAEDGEDGFADLERKRLAGLLTLPAYHRVVRSSLTPFFTFQGSTIKKETEDYFKAHGGYENAHKAKFTVYNP